MNTLLYIPPLAALAGTALSSAVALHAKRTGVLDTPDALETNIDGYLRTEMRRLGIPGMALGIVHDSRVLLTRGFGAADSNGCPITPQTLFHIGSLHKSFTALAVMQLVEAGKLALDTPVKKYLPWFTLADKVASSRITVRQLLNHSSGISTVDGNRYWAGSLGMEEAARRLRSVRLQHAPGTRFEYCNMNFVVLGLLIEEASGESYAHYLDWHILAPLQMHCSQSSHASAVDVGLAQGHYYALGRVWPREGIFPEAYVPAGGLAASAEEMTHYLIAQMNGGQYGEFSVLSPQGMTVLQSPAIAMGAGTQYAMGWVVGSIDGVRTVWHNGDITNFHAVALLQPETGWGVVLLANATGLEQILQVDEMARNVSRMLNAQAPAQVAVPPLYRLLYWGVLLTPLLMGLGIAWELLGSNSDAPAQPWQAVLTAVLYLAVALLCRFKIPGLVPFPLNSMRIYYPEFAYALLSSTAMGFAWSIAFPVIGWIQRGALR